MDIKPDLLRKMRAFLVLIQPIRPEKACAQEGWIECCLRCILSQVINERPFENIMDVPSAKGLSLKWVAPEARLGLIADC